MKNIYALALSAFVLGFSTNVNAMKACSTVAKQNDGFLNFGEECYTCFTKGHASHSDCNSYCTTTFRDLTKYRAMLGPAGRGTPCPVSEYANYCVCHNTF